MAIKIKLNSRYLKVGDQIIRTQPLTDEVVSNPLYTSTVVTVLEKQSHHLKISWGDSPVIDIISFHKWNDGNWVRWK